MARTIKTTRQDLYIRLVENAASQEGRESDSDDFIFQYQYELFSLGVVVGYAQDDQISDPDDLEDVEWSQDILKLTNLNDDHEHRIPVEIVNRLVFMESNEAEDLEDVWEDVLRYADAGIEHIDEGIAVQEDFDFVGTVRDFSNPEWRERLRDVIVNPDTRQ